MSHIVAFCICNYQFIPQFPDPSFSLWHIIPKGSMSHSSGADTGLSKRQDTGRCGNEAQSVMQASAFPVLFSAVLFPNQGGPSARCSQNSVHHPPLNLNMQILITPTKMVGRISGGKLILKVTPSWIELKTS